MTTKRQLLTGLALTDHGNLYGALDFYRKAQAAGINPIVGYEAYIAPQSRFQKDAGGMKEASFHLTLLAQNAIGFKNLVKMASRAFLEGFYFKPRIDKELLEAHSEGIICLSGCVSGEFSRTILQQHGDLRGPTPPLPPTLRKAGTGAPDAKAGYLAHGEDSRKDQNLATQARGVGSRATGREQGLEVSGQELSRL